ncbi:MAG: CPBP family intramembrane metalloprotease, partial [Bergeyella zoohelcum]|nr:CPBP family intramembrane metalloprotease [Bergeyella zoohelcum]
MNKKNLPNYTFDWAGVLTLILGMLIPQVILTIISLIISLIFNIIIVEKPWFILISTLLMWFSVISAYNLLICKPKTGEYLRFNTSIPTLKTISITIPMVLGMMFINEFTSSLLPTTGTFWGNQYLHFIEMIEKLSENKPVTILLVGIIAPIFEEIVFRGIIQKGLINKGMNVQKAIWISAIVFGIV